MKKALFLLFILLTSRSFCQTDSSCSLFLPNTFSPTHEDYWKIVSNCQLKKFSLKLYDRWGEVVLKTDSLPKKGIDISSKNNLPSEIYVYTLEYVFSNDSLKKRRMTGHVTLIR